MGAGGVGSACLLSLVMRGVACQVVVLDKYYERARGVVADRRYGATLSPAVELRAGDYPDLAEADVCFANITMIEGTGARQLGIGAVTSRIAEAILRDEHAVIPLGSRNPKYGVTLSLPNVIGRSGVSRIPEPEMSDNERQGLQRGTDVLRSAVARIVQSQTQRPARQGG